MKAETSMLAAPKTKLTKGVNRPHLSNSDAHAAAPTSTGGNTLARSSAATEMDNKTIMQTRRLFFIYALNRLRSENWCSDLHPKSLMSRTYAVSALSSSPDSAAILALALLSCSAVGSGTVKNLAHFPTVP